VARYAFIIGANGPDAFGRLKYAADDAARFGQVISGPHYSFTIVQPTQPSDPYEIKRELDKVAKSCREEDAYIFFFSGHGELLAGDQCSCWMSVPGDENTYLPVGWIKEARGRCAVANRLIILDCCHAEAATGGRSKVAIDIVGIVGLGIEAKNELMLLASRRLEVVREFEHLGGSFLTTEMCAFLSGVQTQTVGLSHLMAHLHSAAIAHNNRATGGTPPKVPIPFLNGDQQGEFLFTVASWPDLSEYVTIIRGEHSVSFATATAMGISAAAQGHPMQLSATYIHEKAQKARGGGDSVGEFIGPVVFVLEHWHNDRLGHGFPERREVGSYILLMVAATEFQ